MEEDCNQPSRLLIRTASNAYFPQIVSVLSLPDRGGAIDGVVVSHWDDLGIVDSAAELALMKKKPKVATALETFDDDEVLEAIARIKGGSGVERHVKEVELEALLGAPEGFGDDIPINPDFHARRLPDSVWRTARISDGIAAVIQLHRLREVLALIGFTRLEAAIRDIHGEYDTDVERAEIAMDPSWYPAIENRGEGVFVQLSSDAVNDWQRRSEVRRRVNELREGHKQWIASRKGEQAFPGGPYILLHTLAHLLIQSLAMRCGYPASSLRERIYAESGCYGFLIYTGTPDAEGTLGGLVQQARYIEDHLAEALRMGQLCSNDPICAQHAPSERMRNAYLHGAACHGCTLIAETSCEMRNDYLDRALVVPILGAGRRGFLSGVPMIESLAALSPHLRDRLAKALELGLLPRSCSASALRSVLDVRVGLDEVLEGLHELDRLGLWGRTAAAWLRALERGGRPSVVARFGLVRPGVARRSRSRHPSRL